MKTLLTLSFTEMNESYKMTMTQIPVWVWGLYFAVLIFELIAMWRVYTKAGQPGWACIVPIYNLYVLIKIAKKPANWFWILLGLCIGFIIPFVNIACFIALLVMNIMILHGVSTSFGQGAGFTVGLILLGFVFYPILAFGNYAYIQDDLKPSSPDLMDA